jgi:SAM-dependent methyltransferase
MRWGNMPKDIRDTFCCPFCQGDLLEGSSSLECAVCGNEWPFIDARVPCFALSVYESPQAKTERISSRGKIRGSMLYQKVRDSLRGTRASLRQCVLRDEAFWEAQLGIFRDIEEDVVLNLLDAHLSLPAALTLEIGVGHRDKTELYNRITENAICSDIFYDEQTTERYESNPSTLYSVINADQLPFREGSMELILTSHVVEHFPDKSRALNNIRYVLKSDGWACHVVPTTPVHVFRHIRSVITNPFTLTPRILGGVHGEYDSIDEELLLNTVNSWRNLFVSHGFQIIADTSGKTFGMRPLSAATSQKIANALCWYGSHVFLMRKLDA